MQAIRGGTRGFRDLLIIRQESYSPGHKQGHCLLGQWTESDAFVHYWQNKTAAFFLVFHCITLKRSVKHSVSIKKV